MTTTRPSDPSTVVAALTLEEKAVAHQRRGLLAHQGRSAACRRSCSPTGRTGCASRRAPATTSACTTACRRPASRRRSPSGPPGTPTLLERVGVALGEEAQAEGVGVLLGPGINIKRSPLCGRNFEYLSEDPLVSGRPRRGAGPRPAEPGRRRVAQALRRQQPGDRPACGSAPTSTSGRCARSTCAASSGSSRPRSRGR